jgi:hypothetical protein
MLHTELAGLFAGLLCSRVESPFLHLKHVLLAFCSLGRRLSESFFGQDPLQRDETPQPPPRGERGRVSTNQSHAHRRQISRTDGATENGGVICFLTVAGRSCGAAAERARARGWESPLWTCRPRFETRNPGALGFRVSVCAPAVSSE